MEIKICHDESRIYPYRLFVEIGEHIFVSVTEFETEEDAQKAAGKIMNSPSPSYEIEWIPLFPEEGEKQNGR